jgi:hypothetical protein
MMDLPTKYETSTDGKAATGTWVILILCLIFFTGGRRMIGGLVTTGGSLTNCREIMF